IIAIHRLWAFQVRQVSTFGRGRTVPTASGRTWRRSGRCWTPSASSVGFSGPLGLLARAPATVDRSQEPDGPATEPPNQEVVQQPGLRPQPVRASPAVEQGRDLGRNGRDRAPFERGAEPAL